MPTAEQEKYIRENYLTKSHKQIAEDLGLAAITVSTFCSKNKLKKTDALDDPTIKFVLLNADTMTLKELAAITQTSIPTVSKILKDYDILKKRIRRPANPFQDFGGAQQLCWSCERATNPLEHCYDGMYRHICSWAKRLKPVRGWTTAYINGKEYVKACPLYKPEKRRVRMKNTR